MLSEIICKIVTQQLVVLCLFINATLLCMFFVRTVSLAFAALLVGCLPPEPIQEPPIPRTITTKIQCGGEWAVRPSEPLAQPTQSIKPSKAQPNDLLAVQIYAKPIGAPDNQYEPFAHGLFDTWSDLSVELRSTNTYKMVASMVVEGKKVLYSYISGYGDPFSAGTENIKVTNSFAYNTTRAMTGLTAGAAQLVSGQTWKRYARPPIDRYCAVLTDYTPVENQPVELLLKRVSFAIKLSAPDLPEGSITVSLHSAPPIELTSKEPIEIIYSLLGSISAVDWLEPTYEDQVVCTALWKKNNGDRVNIGPKEGVKINARRNHRIPIELYTSGQSNGVGISIERPQWEDQPTVKL